VAYDEPPPMQRFEDRVLESMRVAGLVELEADCFAFERDGVQLLLHRTKEGAIWRASIEALIPESSNGPGPSGRPVAAWLPEMQLTREGAEHRAARARGHATEVSTGDASFDRKIYVRSDARHHEVLAVLGVEAVRANIVALLESGVVSVSLENGKRARLRIGLEGLALLVDAERMRELVRKAGALWSALPAFSSTRWRCRLGPGGLLSTGLLLAMVPGVLVAYSGTQIWPTADAGLALQALLGSGVIYALVSWLGLRAARRSSAGYGRIAAIVLGGLVSIPTWVVGAAHAINGAADPSLSLRRVELLEIDWVPVSKGRGRAPRVRILCPPNPNPITLARVRDVRRLPERGPIVARAGDGRLGHMWFDEAMPLESSAEP
jgi:hypothetical protein